MAEQPDRFVPDTPAAPWRRWVLWGAGVAAALAVIVVVLAVFRQPLAEKIVKDKLASLGLGGSQLAVTRLTPWSVGARNLATGPAGTVRIGRLTADLTWAALFAPKIGAVTLEDLQLSLSLSKNGTLEWGDLAPLTGGEGSGQSTAFPEIMLRNGLIEVDHSGGPTVLSVTAASIVPGDDGAVIIKGAAIDVVHPMGEASLKLSGERSADGTVDLQLIVDGVQGQWQGVSLAGMEGKVRIAGDPSTPSSMAGEADLNVFGLVLPQGILADGKVAAKIAGGAAEISATLSDNSLALKVAADGVARLDDAALPVTASVSVQAGEMSRLPFAGGLEGAADVRLSVSAPLPELLAIGPDGAPLINVEASARKVEALGVPGVWSGKAVAALTVANGEAELNFESPMTVEGKVFGGTIAMNAPGTVRFGLTPFRVTALQPGQTRLTVDKVKAGDVIIDGPVTFLLTPKAEGIDLAKDGGVFPLQGAEIALAVKTPSLVLRAGGKAAVLRTAKLKGGIAATFPAKGAPGMKVRISGLDVHIPDLDMEAQGINLYARTRGGPDRSWNMSAKAMSLRHTAAAPFDAEAKGHWNAKRWRTDGTLRQRDTGLILSLGANGDSRGDTGRARIDMIPLNLAGVPNGIHGITPLLAPFIQSLTGTVQVSAATAWDASGIKPIELTGTLRGAGLSPAAPLLPSTLQGAFAGISTMSLRASLPVENPAAGLASFALSGGNVRVGQAQATGISAQVDLENLWPPRSPPGQEIRIAQVVAALPVADGRLRFQVFGPSDVLVERAELTTIGGRVWAEGVSVQDGNMPDQIILNVDGLGLRDLAAQVNVLGLKADGLLSGKIPLRVSDDGKVTVQGGLLESLGKGLVSFTPPARAADEAGTDSRMNMALDVLEDLRFDRMTVNLDGDVRKDVNIRLRLQGRNPKIQEGRPVDLTVNLSGNLGEAIQAEFQNFDIKGLAGAATRKN